MERSLTMVALFAALIAVLGLFPSFMLFTGVPISAQSLGVMLCGAVLGARRGALAVLLFLALVALGLPLLAGGRGGLGAFVGPTAGFLYGFPVAAFVTGWIAEHWRGVDLSVSAGAGALIGGVLVLYAFGAVGMMLVVDLSPPEAVAALGAFIPGDMIKAVVAGLVTGAIYRARPGFVMTR
ncbi:MAG: ECF-type biotin uptake system substrate-binding component BioY [Rhodobacteraceae bacterium HLUCCA12]|nr:MAG: ECF-type biotin uptake system substrate-binding component BioY [Rhodobacteraceae bacterium HLUCCA12]